MSKSNGRVTDIFRQNEIVELSTGVKVKFNVAPRMLLEQAILNVDFPEVPVQTLEDGRQVENPNHPEYLKARIDAINKQGDASIDVMIAFVDLVDGLPKDDDWIKRIDYLTRLGHIDLGNYNLEDELDKEFVYKKYIAFGRTDLNKLTSSNRITEEDRQTAKDSFQGDAESD